MKVFELLNEESIQQYSDRLIKTLKIKHLGTGAYGSVFQHSTYHNVAVKIFENDPMYLKYIKICQTSTNPWLPRVVSIHKLKMNEIENLRSKSTAWIVFFEKLRPVKKSELKAAVQTILKQLPDSDFDRYDPDTWLNERRSYFSTFEEFQVRDWKRLSKLATDPSIKELSTILAKVYAEDIHDGNVMIRSDGQLVFTDPVAS